MNPEDIKLSDWHRILVGNAPPGFFIEVIIRTVFVFLLLIISLRLMGKRMSARTSRLELTALFALAAAIGVPLQSPDRGLLPAIVIAALVILVGRLVARLTSKDQSFEETVVGDLAILVEDGVIKINELKKTGLTLERLLAQLRESSIRHLGEVKRFYFEANGSFALLKNEQPKPGLAVIPLKDKEFLDEQKQADMRVCRTCGNTNKDVNTGKCTNCGDKEWVNAIE
jgi:uncharacterized membrane protein YcaP (DUF421 family)